MSSRAFRKLSRQQKDIDDDPVLVNDDDESISSDYKVVSLGTSSGNPFSLLNEETYDEDDENDDFSPFVGDQGSGCQVKKKKKRKKKKKKKKKTSKELDFDDLDHFDDDDDDNNKVDPRWKEILDGKKGNEEGEDNYKRLMYVDAKRLNKEAELIRLFGRKTISANERRGNVFSRGHKGGKSNRGFLIVSPKEGWPRYDLFSRASSLSMEPIEDDLEGDDDFNEVGRSRKKSLSAIKAIRPFKFMMGEKYRSRFQEPFLNAINHHDPNIFAAILRQCPYHVDSLLSLSEMFKITGELEMSADHLERALFAHELAFHPSFSLSSGRCRIPYSYQENKSFHLSLFRYVQLLGREGCYMTALEVCKLMLSLDPTDPLRVFLLFDFFCIKSGAFSFLADVFSSKDKDILSRNLHVLPNWCFSLALVKHFLEGEKEQTPFPIEKSSDELLRHALMLFPTVLPKLVEKLTLPPNSREEEPPWLHSFYVTAVCPKRLEHLQTLFVVQNHSVWNRPDIVEWLTTNARAVAKMAVEGHQSVSNCATLLQEFYGDDADFLNLYDHLVLSEFTDELENALPPDLIAEIQQGRAGPQVYEDLHNQQQQQQSPVQGLGGNPVGLFLNSLVVPFDPANAGSSNWVDTLLNLLPSSNSEGHEDE